ncbi:MAG: amidohydrolase [Firmicutes bacterium]|nr:amidohydrolase [Bacillota bacterium]
MQVQELKKRVLEAIDEARKEIISLGEEILLQPELGYKEFKTSARVEREFRTMRLEYKKNLAVTGLKAYLPGGSGLGRVAILGELDAVVAPGHPQADPQTGAAHACGHNAQVAAMLGAGIGLWRSGVHKELDGDVVLMAVPAEEPVELEYRRRLVEEGRIRFMGGKQELIALGEFEDIDAAMMVHLSVSKDAKKATVGGTSNGFLAKLVRYVGREAHAGRCPPPGINALNAAMLGLMGIHAQRETFRDEDSIRVHPIITRGGDLVNVIPADVRMETYVRGRSIEAVLAANKKVNRALRAGAEAIGARVEITEIPGFLPVLNQPLLSQLFARNLADLLGEEAIGTETHGAGSTDMGDVMHLLPGIHPYIAAAQGRGHSEEYRIVDRDLAYLVPAKALALTAIDLLVDRAARLREVKAGYKAKYNREEYLRFWEKVVTGGETA